MAILFWLSVILILYTYFGYPILLYLLAKFRPKLEYYPAEMPTVTLLIPAYNEAAVIAKKIENCLALDYPTDALQILVVTDGSEDETPDIVKKYKNRGIELSHDPERRGKMAAITRAISKSRGEIIVLSDANNMYLENSLRELITPFTNAGIGGATGAKTIIKGDGALGESEGLYWRYESFIRKQESLLSSCTGANGEIIAIRSALFEPPPDKIINDDFYLAMNTIGRGYRFVYVPQAKSFERVSTTARGEVERRARIIAGRFQALLMAKRYLPFRYPLVTWQVISHKYLRLLVPFAMISAFLSNVWLVLRPSSHLESPVWYLNPPFNWILLAGQALFYTLAIPGYWMEAKGKLGKLLYLPTFLVNSNWATLIGFFRFITGKQTSLWKRVPRRDEEK